MSDEKETLLEFPCQFSVKAMGYAAPDFDAVVLGIVREHVPNVSEGAVKSRSSKGGKYLAVTVTFEATSKPQLDAIYHALTDSERVLMSL
ncbi:MAG: DUF493 domain-containing protein [Candidatus Sedimenticola sp. (ex Thyasira tokunagai)]